LVNTFGASRVTLKGIIIGQVFATPLLASRLCSRAIQSLKRLGESFILQWKTFFGFRFFVGDVI